MKKYDLKSILIGVLIGIIVTTSVLYLIGDIDIQTEIQLGEKENKWRNYSTNGYCPYVNCL